MTRRSFFSSFLPMVGGATAQAIDKAEANNIGLYVLTLPEDVNGSSEEEVRALERIRAKFDALFEGSPHAPLAIIPHGATLYQITKGA